MKTLAVLFGGQSTEHEISDLSACFVAENLDETKYELMMIGITKDGRWFWYTGPVDAIRCHTWQDDAENLVPCVVSPCSAHHGLLLLDKAAGTFAVRRVDVVFPVLHGKNGEDGTVQGLLTLAGIPYVGCDTYASAVCMNKIATKRLCAGLGISMAASVELTAGPDFDMNAAVCAAEEKLGYPVFVKPANAGSSVGITKARSRAELIAGIEKAFENDRLVLMEEAVVGREVEVAVLGGERDFVSECGEIAPNSDFYDYKTKYISDVAEYYIPARLRPETAEIIRGTAGRIFRALGCTGLSRVDFFVTADETVYFNEINTLPGFTAISMYPQLMRRSGLTYAELIDRLVEDACRR